MEEEKGNKDLYCKSCGKRDKEYPTTIFVRISEDDSLILCEDCINKIYQTLHKQTDADEYVRILTEEAEGEGQPRATISKPSEIRAHLDQYIIGQDEAKEVISVAAYNHYKHLVYAKEHEEDKDAVELQKSNILMIGASGVGKTETVRALAKFMNVPLVICDTTSLSRTGFVGADPVSVLTNLLSAANGSVEDAERGIIYLDEFDKLANRGNSSVARDVTGEGVQMELLKMVEGNVVDVPVAGIGIKGVSETVKMDTSRILFICGGAFSGIENIIKKRLKKNGLPEIGFGNTAARNPKDKNKEYNELITSVTTEDLLEYGLMQEMLGRLPVVCPLKELSEDELMAILTQPKNAIVKQYTELLKMDKAKLTIEKEALREIAKEAIQRKVGARGLRSILESVLLPIMYRIPDTAGHKEVVITKDCIVNHHAPEITVISPKRRKKEPRQRIQQIMK